MVGELLPVAVDPATADREFWTRYHELRRVRHLESRPDDPLMPDETVEAEMSRVDPFEDQAYYEIARDGVMLSWFHGQAVTPASPEYATNRHLYWADAFVRPDERRKGIASLWLPVIASLMDGHGSTVVGMQAEEEPGHAFLSWMGGAARMTNIESRLDLSRVDWSMLERWAAEGAQRSPDTRLEIYDGPLPVSMWADFTPQLSSMLNTMPWEGLEHGDIVVTPATLREWYERLELAGEVLHTVMTREPDGVISGITDVLWATFRRRLLYQMFTGVRPDARSRGLGKWIKAAMLLHMRELFPDIETVVTDNARSNGPMLKINRTIGFKPYRTQIEYQISRADLESRIRSV